ncbi:MAG: hypothetical protein RL372_2032, partial [Bacteroidota bacterium]
MPLTTLQLRTLFTICIIAMVCTSCLKEKNGGLFLPEGFEAVVVVDSLPGRARHLAVNDNG